MKASTDTELYRLLEELSPDNPFFPGQDSLKAQVKQWHAKEVAQAEARGRSEAHSTEQGWCCACPADIAFAESNVLGRLPASSQKCTCQACKVIKSKLASLKEGGTDE